MMSIRLPGRYDKKWTLIFIIYTVITWAAFILSSSLILDIVPEFKNFLGTLIVSMILSFIICLMGFLNARIAFYMASLGLLTGIIMMISIFTKRTTGWEDLIGPLVMLEFFLFGVGLGLLTQLVMFLIGRYRGKKSG